jgi:dihydroorotate dehydrogenase electron transfer subunit
MKKVLKGEITGKKQVCEGVFELKFKSELRAIAPGEFLTILCPPKVLRRPFGVAGFENGILRIIVKLEGGGTKYLSGLEIGSEIDFLAPLGRGFELENKKSLIVGAGIGVAPLFYLNDELKKIGAKTLLVCGFTSCETVIDGVDEVKIGGSILDELPKYLREFKPEKIYSCGPDAVLRAISKFGVTYDIPTEIAMGKVMACGIGVCRGCVIKTTQGQATICHDGPVFRGAEVLWE